MCSQGITFTAIILRVSMKSAGSHDYSMGGGTRNVSGGTSGAERYPMQRRPVAVNVSHLVEVDHGGLASDHSKDSIRDDKLHMV